MTITKKLPIVAASFAAAGFMAFAAAPATTSAAPLGGLENINLGLATSTMDEDGNTSSAGLKLITENGLENLGLGTNLMTQDEDGNKSSLGLGLESTDDLENLAVGIAGMTQDEDGNKSDLGLGLSILE
jgi:hypothetical protein